MCIEMQFVNLTPHTVVLYNEATKDFQTVEPSRKPARIGMKTQPADLLTQECPYPVIHNTPDPSSVRDFHQLLLKHAHPQSLIIVSQMCLRFVHSALRPYVVAPDTSDKSAIKDEMGRIKAVKRLIRA